MIRSVQECSYVYLHEKMSTYLNGWGNPVYSISNIFEDDDFVIYKMRNDFSNADSK